MEKNPVCEMLGIRYPVFQGGMAWIADAKLASAVSEAAEEAESAVSAAEETAEAEVEEEAEDLEAVYRAGAAEAEAQALGVPLHGVDRQAFVVERFDDAVARAAAVRDQAVAQAVHRLVVAAVVDERFPVEVGDPAALVSM